MEENGLEREKKMQLLWDGVSVIDGENECIVKELRKEI